MIRVFERMVNNKTSYYKIDTEGWIQETVLDESGRMIGGFSWTEIPYVDVPEVGTMKAKLFFESHRDMFGL